MWTEVASPESVQFLLENYFIESLRTSQVWEDVTRKGLATWQQAFEEARTSENILARFGSLTIRGELIRACCVAASMLWMRGNEKPNCLQEDWEKKAINGVCWTLWDGMYVAIPARCGLVCFVCNRKGHRATEYPTNQGLLPEAIDCGRPRYSKCERNNHSVSSCMFVGRGWDGKRFHSTQKENLRRDEKSDVGKYH